MSAFRCCPVALFLLVVFLAGCYSWRPSTISPPELIADEQPSQVRVSRTDGTRLAIRRPLIRNDSIATRERVCSGRLGCYEVTNGVLPLDQIEALEVRRFSAGRTAVLVVTPFIAAYVFGWWICRDIDC